MVIQAQDFRESAAMPSYILGRQLIVGWVACILLLSLLCLFLGSYEITPEIMVRTYTLSWRAHAKRSHRMFFFKENIIYLMT